MINKQQRQYVSMMRKHNNIKPNLRLKQEIQERIFRLKNPVTRKRYILDEKGKLVRIMNSTSDTFVRISKKERTIIGNRFMNQSFGGKTGYVNEPQNKQGNKSRELLKDY